MEVWIVESVCLLVAVAAGSALVMIYRRATS